MIDLIDPDRAVRAAVALAARFGVRSEPVLLSNGSNVVVHLAPAPVVARVGTLCAAVRPYVAENMARDLALAGYLAEVGAPVVAPSRVVPPGPHREDGRTITFWTYVPHVPRYTWHPHEVGPLLAELHQAMRGFPGELPGVPPIEAEQVVAFLRSVDGLGPLDEAMVPDLLADAAALRLKLSQGDAVPLHGDAHPGNLLHTPDGPMWTDFEDAWRGPLGWDLACLELTSRLDGRAALAGYPGPRPDPAPFLAGRRMEQLIWSLVFRWRFPDDARFQDVADGLARWRVRRT